MGRSTFTCPSEFSITTMIQKNYRPDIDGLRAIAVVGVLLFHFGFAPFGGGFTGVDVFFVISGFLITQNIIADLQAGSFSFETFYIRRMRRLFPALAVVWLLTLIGGFLLFAPEHFEGLGQSLIASILSISNFFFWREAGYFDAASHFKPLLHTWSLAVEEQFYLVWPAILFGLSLLRKPVWILLFLLLSGATSLILAERWLAIDPSAAFYLAPFRIIEFAMGAILVWLIQFQPRRKWILEVLVIAGIAMILFAFTSYTKTTPFPGVQSLLPSIGTALIIYSGTARYAGTILRLRPVVAIGLISYSLYLVHWPLLCFYRYWKYSDLSLADRIVLFLLSFVLAYFSYKFIEQPFRRAGFAGSKFGQRRYALACLAIALVLVAGSTSAWRSAGFPGRLHSKLAKAKDAVVFHHAQYGGKIFPTLGMIGARKKLRKDYDVVIAGDSYAHHYATGFSEVFAKQGIMAANTLYFGCLVGPEISHFFNGKVDPVCTERVKTMFKLLAGNTKPLILSQSWVLYPFEIADRQGKQIAFNDMESYYTFLIDNLKKLRQAIGPDRQFIILGNSPGSGNQNDVVSCLNRPSYIPNNCRESLIFSRKKGEGQAINEKLRDFAASVPNTVFLDPYEVFCDGDTCQSVDFKKDTIWYSDGRHLSIDGSIKAVEFFRDQLVAIIRGTPAK